MERFGRNVLLLAVLAPFVVASGCRRNNTAPTPTPTPVPSPVRGVIATFGFDQFTSGLYVAIPLPLSQGGVLDTTVDWTFPTSWIYVYIAQGTCTFEQLSTNTCPFLVRSESQLPKPRFVRTTNLAPGTYSLILYNVPRDRRAGIGSDNTESVSFQIGLTVGPGAQARPIDAKPILIQPDVKKILIQP
jgi:hypothetical protein